MTTLDLDRVRLFRQTVLLSDALYAQHIQLYTQDTQSIKVAITSCYNAFKEDGLPLLSVQLALDTLLYFLRMNHPQLSRIL